MNDFWWRLPLLRGLSPLRRGFVEAVFVIFSVAVVADFGINRFFSDPALVSNSLSQIGATLLVAYAVQTGWVIQASRSRGQDRENWVGMTAGIGCSALTGIIVALSLSAHQERLDLLEGFGFSWAVTAIGVLGIWTALQTWSMYDLNHRFNAEYPDE
jgi:hypothetical protein